MLSLSSMVLAPPASFGNQRGRQSTAQLVAARRSSCGIFGRHRTGRDMINICLPPFQATDSNNQNCTLTKCPHLEQVRVAEALLHMISICLPP
jgi:hypothetical protein